MAKELVQELKKYSLNEEDMLDLVDGKAKIMTYSELTNYDDIDDALGKHGAIILLYESEKYYGHWTALFKRGNVIEFFDSYGLKPDDELKMIPDNFRRVNNMELPHLTALLYYSPKKYRISYNEHYLQELNPDINTCGRWVAMRLIFRDLTLRKFIDLLRHRKWNLDDLVTIVTFLLGDV